MEYLSKLILLVYVSIDEGGPNVFKAILMKVFEYVGDS